MAIGNYYPISPTVVDQDLFLGTRAGGNNTVNYTAQTVSNYLNTNSKIAIGGQVSFKFDIAPNIPKTISLPGGGGDGTLFSSITQLVVSSIDVASTDTTIFLGYLVGSEILLSQQNQPNLFGHYKITNYTRIGTSNFYNLNLQYIGGNGTITRDTYYNLSNFVLSSGGNIPTKTSNLINDGDDGINPFISSLALNGYAQESWVTSNFYPLTSNPSGFITSSALTPYLLSTTAASTYFPIPTGTISQYIRGNGTLATFPTIPTVTPSALTKTDDTNVTLTLGGSPNTALLAATSLTLGWTGTLADSRITSAATWNAKQDALSGTGLVKSTAGIISYITDNSSNWNTAYTNRITSLTTTGTGAATLIANVLNIPTPPAATFTSLTTTGSSGVATLSSGILNIPDYGSALTGYVPYTGAIGAVNLGSNNLSANNFFDGFTSVVASGTLITLTINSTPSYLVTGSGGQTIKMPVATTLPNGALYYFNNNQSSGAILVNNNSNTLIKSVPSGALMILELTDNSTAAGGWDAHFQAPSNVSWSTNTLDYAGSITSATWNGAVVAINRGGTGSATQNFVDLTTNQTVAGAKTFSIAPILSSLTASQILALDASNNIQSLPTATYPSLTELSYVKGVTSAIQTQINSKQSALVSGTNIKSINGISLLGSGNLPIMGAHAIMTPYSGLTVSASINISGAASTFVGVANRLTVNPFIPAQTIISSSLYINVTVLGVGALAQIVIYSDLNGKPDTRLYQSTDLDCSTIGKKTVTTTQTFTAGNVYWIGVQTSSTQTITGIGAAGLIPAYITTVSMGTSYYITPTYGSAPTSFGTPSQSTGNVAFIGITI